MNRLPPVRFSLWRKLTVAFLLVAVLGIAMVSILANRAAGSAFDRYLAQDEAAQIAQIQSALAEFYLRNQGWEGVDTLLAGYWSGRGQGGGALALLDENGELTGTSTPGFGFGQGRGMGPGPGAGPNAGDMEDSAGEAAADLLASEPYPITVDGRQVGTLLVSTASLQAGRQTSLAAEAYLADVNRAILLAGGAAVLAALVLGLLLARGLTRPLRSLTAATRALAQGEPAEPVPVETHDELGRLAASFNQMTDSLAATERQRQQLFADIAHELRTPISVVRGHLEGMLDGVFPMSAENVTIAHEETLLLTRLVEELRTLSLAESGRLPLEKEPLDLSELARQAAAAFQPLAESQGVSLELDLAGGLPPVSADAARLQQVLGNLLSNALRYANQSSSAASLVTVRVAAVGDQVRLSVADNGPGLSPEARQHVFDRFWRADAARSRDRGGSGLGLAISRGIIEAHGGRIWVESEEGEGTVFRVELPV